MITSVDSIASIPLARVQRTDLSLYLPVLHDLIACEVTADLAEELSWVVALSETVSGAEIGIVWASVRLECDVAVALVWRVDSSATGGESAESIDVVCWCIDLVAIGTSDHNMEFVSVLSFVCQGLDLELSAPKAALDDNCACWVRTCSSRIQAWISLEEDVE